MVDEKTGRAVDKDQKGRGYELNKGKFVEIEENELKAVKSEATHTVDIQAFVPLSEIDKRYLEKPYYVAPRGKESAEAFAVIRDAMKDSERVALAKIVIAGREHVIALEALGKGMLATTLRSEDEVRDPVPYFKNVPSPRIGKDMVKLAQHILESKSGHFDASKFKDEYDIALKKLVRRKAKGGKIEIEQEAEKADNVINLMDALKQSIKPRGGSKSKSAVTRNSKRRTRRAA